MTRRGRILVLLLCVGCSEPVEADLVTAEGWSLVPLEADPFADRYADQPCDERGASVENGLIEIDTTLCRFATLMHPALLSVRADEPIVAVMFHDSLFTEEEDAFGTSIVALGSNLWWEETIAIPRSSEVYPREELAGVDLEVGDPIYWHVDNHGGNSWNLSHIRVESARREVRRAE